MSPDYVAAERAPEKLYDLAIIGGGIARDAAGRGWRCDLGRLRRGKLGLWFTAAKMTRIDEVLREVRRGVPA